MNRDKFIKVVAIVLAVIMGLSSATILLQLFV